MNVTTNTWQVSWKNFSASAFKMDGYLVLNERDNVCVALRVITEGESVCGCIAKSDIPKGHKMAISDVAKGEAVLKYGSPIGVALEKITAGEHVHTSNLGYVDDFYSAAASSSDLLEPVIPKNTDSFLGYRRSNGCRQLIVSTSVG